MDSEPTNTIGAPSADATLRIARPTGDLATAERFWREGVGLDVLWRTDGTQPGDHALLMLGLPDARWHLELVEDAGVLSQHPPSEEDLLVLYFGAPASEEWLRRIEAAGGQRVPARNPYWDRWAVTIEDPDGYRLVLSHRTWD